MLQHIRVHISMKDAKLPLTSNLNLLSIFKNDIQNDIFVTIAMNRLFYLWNYNGIVVIFILRDVLLVTQNFQIEMF